MYLNLIQQHKSDLEQFIVKPNFFSRPEKLDLIHTVGLCLYMAANRNQNGYDISSQDYFSELSKYLEKDFPLASPSRSSVCEARQKLAPQAFEFLLEKLRLEEEFLPAGCKWKGHRVYAVDGTKLTLPNSQEILKRFPQQKAGGKKDSPTRMCHYPKALLVTACNVLTGKPIAAAVGNMHSSERDLAISMLHKLRPTDIVMNDRGLDGARVWSACEHFNLSYVTRMRIDETKKTGLIGEVTHLLKNGKQQKVVQYKGQDPETGEWKNFKMRLIRGRKQKDGSTIVIGTNLLDEKLYTPKSILRLYLARWNVETMYFRAKKLLNIEKFHSRKSGGLLQEIYSNLIVLSLVAQLAITVSIAQNMRLDRESPNFKNALNVFKHHIFYWIDPLKKSHHHLQKTIGQITFLVGRILCRKQAGRSNHRYSRSPVNKWPYAKAHKIKLAQQGRYANPSKWTRTIYKRMDENKMRSAA